MNFLSTGAHSHAPGTRHAFRLFRDHRSRRCSEPCRAERRIDWRHIVKDPDDGSLRYRRFFDRHRVRGDGGGLDARREPRAVSRLRHRGRRARRRGSEDEGDGESDLFRVYVSGYDESDRLDRNEDIDQRSVCYIANDRSPDWAWRTNIYIEGVIFRRLVELYASKRIDSARISILLKVLRDPSGKVDVPALRHPMLRTVGDRRYQHSRAHLMSVQTSLPHPRSPRLLLPHGSTGAG